MVLAAEGKTEAVIQRIRTAMEQDEDAETFFDDADLGKVLATKPYAALKAELITDD